MMHPNQQEALTEAGKMISEWLDRVRAANDLNNPPTDAAIWLYRTSAQVLVGFSFVSIYCVYGLYANGELPYKVNIVGSWIVLYGILWQAILRPWRGWRSMEECVFSIGYGCIGLTWTFTEAVQGTSWVHISLGWLAIVILLRITHTMLGIMVRR